MSIFNRFRQSKSSPESLPTPVYPKVQVIIHNPVVRSQGGRKLSALLKWNDPDHLVQQYIADLRNASYGYVNYEIAERIELDGCPVKEDGFAYQADEYYQRWYTRTGWHEPDRVDYGRLIRDFQMIEKINEKLVDEVWLMGFPYAGYYESQMVGPGAFWCNSPPIENGRTQRRFIIMGFNFERGVGEMLESFGHRAESIMAQLYRGQRGERNLWAQFTRYDKTHPGRAECGNVHFAPNSDRDYDWGNRNKVRSNCDAWLNFPDLNNQFREVDCREWGNGDIRLHHLWWLRHFPHGNGRSHGISNNWWEYVIDPNKVKNN